MQNALHANVDGIEQMKLAIQYCTEIPIFRGFEQVYSAALHALGRLLEGRRFPKGAGCFGKPLARGRGFCPGPTQA